MKVLQYIFLLIYILILTVSADYAKSCECYMLGTVGNIEGESVCNSTTSQCKCYPNVIGKNCNKCKEGYYNILSSHGCINCHCNAVGSVNGTCDENSGKCFCKAGFGGFNCNKCSEYTYQLSPDTCKDCNCNIYGSKDLQCNSEGSCPCINNAEGKQCSRCKNNMYNIKEGCITCPKCYDFVQRAIDEHLNATHIFMKLLANAQNQFLLHGNDEEAFVNKFKALSSNITLLKLSCEKYINSEIAVNELNMLLNKTHYISKNLMDLIKQVSDIDFKGFNPSLYQVRQDLKHEKEVLIQCEEVLKNATSISHHLHRHSKSMTQSAEKAIVKSSEIQNKVEEFVNLVTSINETCTDACSTGENLLKDQNKLVGELKILQDQVINTTTVADNLQSYIVSFQEKTNKIRENASELYNLSENIEIPILDDGSNIKISDEINAALLNFEKVAKDFDSKHDRIQNNLERVINSQHGIDNKILKFEQAEIRANSTINDINNILKSAKEGLNNLKDGYRHIKDEVLISLKEIPPIQKKIKAVFDNAENISQLFEEVHNITNNIKEMQLNVSRIVVLIDENIEITDRHFIEVEQLEKQEQELKNSLEKSDEKVKKIRENIKNLNKYNNQTELKIQEIEEFIIYLSVFPTSNEELNDIEDNITILEQMFLTVEKYQAQKVKLEHEVQRVREILESLPIEDLCESAKSEPKTSS